MMLTVTDDVWINIVKYLWQKLGDVKGERWEEVCFEFAFKETDGASFVSLHGKTIPEKKGLVGKGSATYGWFLDSGD